MPKRHLPQPLLIPLHPILLIQPRPVIPDVQPLHLPPRLANLPLRNPHLVPHDPQHRRLARNRRVDKRQLRNVLGVRRYGLPQARMQRRRQRGRRLRVRCEPALELVLDFEVALVAVDVVDARGVVERAGAVRGAALARIVVGCEEGLGLRVAGCCLVVAGVVVVVRLLLFVILFVAAAAAVFAVAVLVLGV